MLRDELIRYYYPGNGHDFSCAEAMLHAMNDYYDLDLPQEMFYAASAFSGGCWQNQMCGGLASIAAVLGLLYSREGHGHSSRELKLLTIQLFSRVREKYGCTNCGSLKPLIHIPDRKCEPGLVEMCDIAEQLISETEIINNRTV
ncbi:MAG: C-GCAxxG-C-C family protein [Erysipelotrichaceae bacterium]|nr:C-GCAxxG-C-C family protein [Erysipelotrichaceae bacterium]MBO4538337.1 C-GCAxxG-C-C family protein [Erysipelotrichaceae bacterium]